MSDFDKEAEREKLREKYENEAADREATRQMSELLLQGATMTNRHCDECSNPIFRYDGQEFCPSCQASAGQQEEEGAQPSQIPVEQPTDDPGQVDSKSQQETTTDRPSQHGVSDRAEEPTDPPPSNESDPGDTAETRQGQGGNRADSSRRRRPDGPARHPVNRRGVETDTEAQPQDRIRDTVAERQSGAQGTAASDPATHSLAEGEAALRHALTKFARLAGETDDPQVARNQLAAAREAAEAIAALRR